MNGTWIRATYHSNSQLQTQGSPADNQGKHPKQAHPVGDRQMADVEALISSRSFHKMYYLESKEITKPKKLSTTVSSDKLSHFMSWTAATREVYMQLLIPMLPGPGAAGEGIRGWKQSLTLLLAGKPKAQRHRGGYREGRSADG